MRNLSRRDFVATSLAVPAGLAGLMASPEAVWVRPVKLSLEQVSSRNHMANTIINSYVEFVRVQLEMVHEEATKAFHDGRAAC